MSATSESSIESTRTSRMVGCLDVWQEAGEVEVQATLVECNRDGTLYGSGEGEDALEVEVEDDETGRWHCQGWWALLCRVF